MQQLGIDLVQIACGDPHHAAWDEKDEMPTVAKAAGFRMTSAMIGFPGEIYTTPDDIKRTGGFGDPDTREERLKILEWGVSRTQELGLTAVTLHAGFIPAIGDAGRSSFLETLGQASRIAEAKGVSLAFETGQETAQLLKQTLVDLQCRNVGVNFDPANMLLYGMGDPIKAVTILKDWIRSVHLKDAIDPPKAGVWGTEVDLGQGRVGIPRFLRALRNIGYDGPLCIEREFGNQPERFAGIKSAVEYLEALPEE